MKFRKKVSAVASIVAFVFLYGFLCWPHVCCIRFVGWVLRYPEPVIRSRVAECAHWWGIKTFAVACLLLRIDITVNVDGDIDLICDSPVIIISNHQSVIDVAVMMVVMKHIKKTNVRWVLKENLRNGSAVIGWIAERTGCAFVSRNKSHGDSSQIKRCGFISAEDNAGIIIFPEGTRFTKSRASDEFKHVLPPKPGGFAIFRSILTNCPVVSVTLKWSPAVADGTRGKTIFQIADFFQKKLALSICIVPTDKIGDNWLNEEWARKDCELSEPQTST